LKSLLKIQRFVRVVDDIDIEKFNKYKIKNYVTKCKYDKILKSNDVVNGKLHIEYLH